MYGRHVDILAPVVERAVLPVGLYSNCTWSSMIQMQPALQNKHLNQLLSLKHFVEVYMFSN